MGAMGAMGWQGWIQDGMVTIKNNGGRQRQ